MIKEIVYVIFPLYSQKIQNNLENKNEGRKPSENQSKLVN